MNPENASDQEPAVPFALQYGQPLPTRPGLVTVIGVIGILIASIGVLAALFEALTAISSILMGRVVTTMRWQTPGSAAVSGSDAVVGIGLAIVLLIGSIGLLGPSMEPASAVLVGTDLYPDRFRFCIPSDSDRRA
jgi:hypothetical protein